MPCHHRERSRFQEAITLPKTYQEINEKIKNGQVVVVTAEEMIGIVEEDGAAKAAG